MAGPLPQLGGFNNLTTTSDSLGSVLSAATNWQGSLLAGTPVPTVGTANPGAALTDSAQITNPLGFQPMASFPGASSGSPASGATGSLLSSVKGLAAPGGLANAATQLNGLLPTSENPAGLIQALLPNSTGNSGVDAVRALANGLAQKGINGVTQPMQAGAAAPLLGEAGPFTGLLPQSPMMPMVPPVTPEVGDAGNSGNSGDSEKTKSKGDGKKTDEKSSSRKDEDDKSSSSSRRDDDKDTKDKKPGDDKDTKDKKPGDDKQTKKKSGGSGESQGNSNSNSNNDGDGDNNGN